jgi:thioredoxin-like negative regulator of GroEL
MEYCSLGRNVFARVDITELQDSTLEDLKVEGIPLIVVFKNGVEVGRHEGMATFEEISEFLEKHI